MKPKNIACKRSTRPSSGAIRELFAATEQLKAANETLEQRVRDRTEELALRNRDMRLVLDNIHQALLTIDENGRLSRERSAIADRWFGAYDGTPTFAEHIEKSDSRFAEAFAMAFEQMSDGVLPIVVSIDQLPVRIRKGELEFRCTFFPLSEGENPRGLLIVVDDVTEQLRQAQDESERSELMALMQELTRDRHGFLSFMEEAGQMIEDLSSGTLDVAGVASLLHTLKGTTAMVGGTMLAALCHRAEEELGEEGLAGAATTLTLLQDRWAAVQEAMTGLLGIAPAAPSR